MFESLSDRLSGIFDKLTGRGALAEQDVAAAMREVRRALLEADVALEVVKTFIDTVTLPDGFFGPKQCGNGRVESNERCEANAFCLVICGVDELCLQLGGAALPIPGTCTSDCMRCIRNE